MRRREFMLALGGVAAWPIPVRAQRAKSPVRLGFLPLGSPENKYDQSLVEAFRQGLNQVGLVENRDILLDVAWTSGDPNQAVSEVLKRGADVLITCGSSASVAAKGQTSTIPIVFVSVGDPIAMGLADSLSRPSRNATGFSDMLTDLSGKLVDLASGFPQGSIHYLWHTAWPDGQNRYESTEKAAQAVGMTLQSKGIADIGQLDDALLALRNSGSRVVVVQPSPLTYGQRRRIITSAMNSGLGTIYAFPVAAREGSLLAYGPDYTYMYRRAPIYVERILKGGNPADLPVEQPTKIEFLVNLGTAKALGIEVPLSLLIRADELLE